MSSGRRELWLGGAHLAVLWAFGFGQPLFEILWDSPEFFVARGNPRGDIILLAIGLVALPPAAMLGVEAVAGLVGPRARRGSHLAFVGLLVAALALQALDSLTGLPAGILVAGSLGVGSAAAAAYASTRFVPAVLTVLAPAPVLFVAIFLFISPVRDLVLPQRDVSALDAEVRSSAPVVVVVFDEFPVASLLDERGRIDARRYPAFAELSREATWYRNATTVADFTNRAVPAFLTGSDPGADTLPNAPSQPDNLFTLLGGSYELDVHEAVTSLCPASLCARESGDPFAERMKDLVADLSIVAAHVLLPDAYREGLPPVDTTFGDFAAGGLDAPGAAEAEQTEALGGGPYAARPAQFERFVDGIGRQRSALHFLHIELPHQPWQYLPNGAGYPVGDPSLQAFAGEHGRWTSQAWLVEHSWQRHLLQAGYADRLIGELMRRLRDLGIWKRALVVVTADHGIAFEPGIYRREVTEQTVEQIAGVPLFVKAPGQRRGGVDDRFAQSVDLLPTIADLLGAELPFETAGEPLTGEPDGEADATAGEVSVADRYGGAQTLSFDDYLERRDAVVEHKLALFGSGGWGDVYGFGPHAGLIGRRVPSEAAPGAPTFALTDGELYDDVDPGSLAVPALVRGQISGDVGADEPIAVAVNGRIAAVGRCYEIGGGIYVSVVVPPSAFRAGDNEVEVIRVVEGEGAVELEPLAGSAG
ncbi:MAG TPA: sulfatase-like hydrolase/transferase [Solirubrobacterales bacterium]|nr:sulfatase-like hydrolase/transferase [Solirubrobacterales bacterium]